MAEKLIPLNLPPGVVKSGTAYGGSRNRWMDSHLVRWFENALRPVGGWSQVKTSVGADIQATGKPRGAHAWRANDRSGWLGVGTTGTGTTKAYAYSNGVLTDITPAGIVSGIADGSIAGGTLGWGEGGWGEGGWGGGAVVGTITDADTWSLDNFGERLLGCLTSDGKLYDWDKNVANDFAQIAGSPTSCRALVVTAERFLFALGAGGDPRKVQWPSQETLTTWTPSAANSAGSFILQTNGRLMVGFRTARETLLWTDVDLWGATYIGRPFVYRFDQRGDNCGLIGPDAVAIIDNAAFWMADGQFFVYSGAVRPIPCDVTDHVFGNLNRAQRAKIAALPLPAFNEVWWFYPSATQSGLENDRYVAYNYRAGFWHIGYIGRATGAGAGVFAQPMLWNTDGRLYAHETGQDRSGEVPYVTSGPLELGDGDRVVRVQRLIPDETVLGQVEATFFASFYPTESETTFGPYPFAQPTDVRLSGRQVRIKLSETGVSEIPLADGSEEADGDVLAGAYALGNDFRIGTFRVGVVPGGYR